MPKLWGLQMKLKKKLMVMFMFSGGIFVIIVSCLRLRFLVSFGQHANLTCTPIQPCSSFYLKLTIRRGIRQCG